MFLVLSYLFFPLSAMANPKEGLANFCDRNKSEETVFCIDFQHAEKGLYTNTDLQKDWPNLQSLSERFTVYDLGVTQNRASIQTQVQGVSQLINKQAISKANQSWLQISYPKDKFGAWQSGATWIMKLPQDYERLSLEYKVMFNKGFLFSREGLFGGKLPGLMGGESISGGGTADGQNGWTSRLMWGQKGRGLGYLYYPDMRDDRFNQQACPVNGLESDDCVIFRNKYFTFDDDSSKKCLSEWAADEYEFRFESERFYKIRQLIQMNTLPKQVGNEVTQGHRDGILRIWLDDKLVVDCTNIRFRDIPELAIDSLIFSSFFGGNTPESSAHPHDEFIYFDDFLIKTD